MLIPPKDLLTKMRRGGGVSERRAGPGPIPGRVGQVPGPREEEGRGGPGEGERSDLKHTGSHGKKMHIKEIKNVQEENFIWFPIVHIFVQIVNSYKLQGCLGIFYTSNDVLGQVCDVMTLL